MSLRARLSVALLVSSLLWIVPTTTAQDPLPCPTAAAPGLLSPGVAVSGNDAIAGTAVADDCYYRLPISGDVTGQQLRVLVTSAQNHDVFVKESVASAAPYACGSTATTATSDTCTVWWPLVASEYSIRVKRSSTTEASHSVTAFLEAAPASGCSNGFAVTPLALGAPATGTLVDVAGARCTYVVSDPSFDPADPGDDVVRSILTPALGNFDISVRRNLPPTGPTSSITLANQRDCVSASTVAGGPDQCDAVLDGAGPLYIMVRRTLGGGDYSLAASLAGSSCELGPGYHDLANGVGVSSSTKILTGSKCFFTASTAAAEDLLTITQSTDEQTNSIINIPAHSLTVVKDAPIGVGAVECSGTSLYLVFSGLNLASPASCSKLLEDGQDHEWSIRVARASGVGSPTDPRVLFTIGYVAQAIPTLLSGVPQLGNVGVGEVDYWKVIVPQDATTLLIQTVGDPSSAACAAGSSLHSTVALACILLPIPMLIACGLAAGYGVDCAALTGSFYDTCVAQAGDEAVCAQIDDARADACAQVNEIQPGTCDGADISGLSVKLTEMDLVVRYREGLPTTALNDCRSATPGVVEQCLFSALVAEVHDDILAPLLGEVDAARGDAAAAVAEQRAPIDAALAELVAVVQAGREDQVEPAWEQLRAAIVDATGQDPGALPAPPSVVPTSLPAFPAIGLPDPLKATPLPGAGKYFVAVRGPSSGLLSQGGDYAIIALHDDVQVPSVADVDTQVDQLQDAIGAPELGLPVLPDALDPASAAIAELDATVDAAIDSLQDALPDDLGLPEDDLPVPIVVPGREGPEGTGLIGLLIDTVRDLLFGN